MLVGIALIFIVGLLFSAIVKKFKLPGLMGMILAGIVLGPCCLNLLSNDILNLSADLRRFALVIILMRAGLSLDLSKLRQNGRPALMLCCVPAMFEILGMVIAAPLFFDITYAEAALAGSVIAAVSPAVIVPRMIRFIEEKRGTDKGIPQMILAGASVDDVFVLVLFSAFVSLVQSESVSAYVFLEIPVSLILGVAVGVICGVLFGIMFKKLHIRDSAKVMLMLAVSFLLMAAEDISPIPFSGLLAVMTTGVILFKNNKLQAIRISDKFSKLWVAAEVILFSLVGAAVDLQYAVIYGVSAVIVIFIALVFRMVGVFASVSKSSLNLKEKLFCCGSYIPKATVQAAIGAVPLSMGLECGSLVLTMSVLAILITAPLGAFLTDFLGVRLLKKENVQ